MLFAVSGREIISLATKITKCMSGHSRDKQLELRNIHLNAIMAPQVRLGTNQLLPQSDCQTVR